MMCAGLEKVGEGAPATVGAEALHTALSFAWEARGPRFSGPPGHALCSVSLVLSTILFFPS